jgi:hypothetical protein
MSRSARQVRPAFRVQPFSATLKAFTLTRDATAIGDAVTIRPPAERLHLFDAQRGQRLN